jgi:RimJ/RimL family protein N-acetyltransferase
MAFGHWMEITEETAAGEVRVRLGPIRRDDAKRFVAAEAGFGMQSYEVGRYIGATSTPTEELELEWWDENGKDKDKLIWGVYVPDESEGGDGWRVVGSTALFFNDRDRRRAESGFMTFDRSVWGKRVASTAHLGRTLFAFDELDMLALTSNVFSANAGSNRAVQGVGYVQTGTGYAEIIVGGKVLDTNHYLLPNPAEEPWRYFWRRPEEEIPQAMRDGREVAKRTMERARASVSFL